MQSIMSLHGQSLRQTPPLRAPTGAIHSERQSGPRDKVPAAPGRRRLWVALALLAGYLLFCHGCHGDEDNELFAPLVRSRPAASVVHFE